MNKWKERAEEFTQSAPQREKEWEIRWIFRNREDTDPIYIWKYQRDRIGRPGEAPPLSLVNGFFLCWFGSHYQKEKWLRIFLELINDTNPHSGSPTTGKQIKQRDSYLDIKKNFFLILGGEEGGNYVYFYLFICTLFIYLYVCMYVLIDWLELLGIKPGTSSIC